MYLLSILYCQSLSSSKTEVFFLDVVVCLGFCVGWFVRAAAYGIPRLGVTLELQSPAYTTAQGNAGSPTH